jgi:hypothetical protein
MIAIPLYVDKKKVNCGGKKAKGGKKGEKRGRYL